MHSCLSNTAVDECECQGEGGGTSTLVKSQLGSLEVHSVCWMEKQKGKKKMQREEKKPGRRGVFAVVASTDGRRSPIQPPSCATVLLSVTASQEEQVKKKNKDTYTHKYT
jgi:hypothetical protein